MPVELECKVRVEHHTEVRAGLKRAGATWVGRVLETNRLFDRADGSLRSSGCALRVRTVTVLDGSGPDSRLTYKGPQQAGSFKRREEIEVVVEDAAAMVDILGALGLAERFLFEKRRETWALDACTVELDEVPGLGRFVEVEGPDEDTIHRVLGRVGLNGAASIRESYVSMLAADGSVCVRFDAEDGDR
ncbi:MAG: class IV adenylate cyclase [Phycisphaerae bacterium]